MIYYYHTLRKLYLEITIRMFFFLLFSDLILSRKLYRSYFFVFLLNIFPSKTIILDFIS